MSEVLDPDTIDLGILFSDPSIFDSRDRWRQAGFDVIDREGSREIMVAGHWAAPSFLFKKFTNKVSPKLQLKNYKLRIDGARAVSQLVVEKNLQRIAVPQKWLRAVPGSKSPHLLIVEKLDVLSRSETKEAYGQIDEQTLRDLCVVVHKFRGLDSGARNMLITRDGKIAFIDTERWNAERDRVPLKHIRAYLTPEQQELAAKIVKKL